MVPAPALIALSTSRHRKSGSERVPSSQLHSTSSTRLRAWPTLATTASCTSSGVIRSLCFMCSGLVAMKVWMRGRAAGRTASPARSMSARAERDRPQTMESRTRLAISLTASKSPFEEIGKPASITSTPISSSTSAMRIFSSRFMAAPGDCSPSRKVVSKIRTRSASAGPGDG